MDERFRVFVITGSVILLILAIILGTVFYFVNGFKGRKSSSSVLTQTRNSPFPSKSPKTSGNVNPINLPQTGSFKSYKDLGFEINYPKEWGLLTCKNSQNIEFDPNDNKDYLGVNCDRAQKPITILTNISNCSGETIILGNVKVVRLKTSTTNYTKYRWCLLNPTLDITHRISNDNSPATSREDFSRQIEDMISKIHFGGGS